MCFFCASIEPRILHRSHMTMTPLSPEQGEMKVTYSTSHLGLNLSKMLIALNNHLLPALYELHVISHCVLPSSVGDLLYWLLCFRQQEEGAPLPEGHLAGKEKKIRRIKSVNHKCFIDSDKKFSFVFLYKDI